MKRYALAGVAWLLLAAGLLAWDTTPVPVAPDGTKAAIDLPAGQHMQNVGGSDGAGLCVPTSITVAAHWQNVTEAYGFRKFAEGRPGGGYPEKEDSDLKLYASRNKIVLPDYVQHTGGDESFLDLCVTTRRCAAITYAGMDGYYDSAIAHMVNLAALDSTHGAILDNNRPGHWVWGSRLQIVNRWKGLDDKGQDMLVPVRLGFHVVHQRVGGGWAFVWLNPPAPPKAPGVTEEPPAAPTSIQSWERETTDEGLVFWMLYENGQLSWVIDPEALWHKATGDDSWEEKPSDKPTGIAAPSEPEPSLAWNSGIDVERVSRTRRYWINGIECSRAKAFARVADPGGLLDDSDRYHLSITGDKAVIVPWFAKGAPLERFARRVHVQVYTADAWPEKERVLSVVQLQEPAKIGGRIVGTATEAGQGTLLRVLSETFDAPVAPSPAPPKPTPAPTPNPAAPDWSAFLKVVLAAVLAWITAHAVKSKEAA